MRSSAFQEKLLSIQSNMLNFAYTLTSNRDDAYDLLQDTTLRVLDSEDKFTENVNFKGWVFTIMRNLFINKYRHEARSAVMVDTSDDLYLLNMSQDSAMESPDGTVSVHEISGILASFAPEYRDPFRLYLAGYKYQEIADRLDVPLGTIKSRIHQARFALRRRLGADYR